MRNMEIGELRFDLVALIGEGWLPMSSYLQLEVGDILLLDQKISAPLAMIAGEKPLFYARPGLSENRKAVRIDERIHT